MSGPASKVSKAALRRGKARRQAANPTWCQYALDKGVSQELIDLRLRVCSMDTTEFKFVTGMHAGDKGDTTQFGDAVIKVTKGLKRGRRPGQKDSTKRAVKRSKAEKTSIKSAAAGHRVVQPGDSALDGPRNASSCSKGETYAEYIGMTATELAESIVASNPVPPCSPLVEGAPLFYVPDTPDKAKVPTLEEMDAAWCIGALGQSPSIRPTGVGRLSQPDIDELLADDGDKGTGDNSFFERWGLL